MKKSVLIILVLALLCTALCACGRDDRGSGNVSDNENGVITDEHNGNDVIDDMETAMPGMTPDVKGTDRPVATAIPGGDGNNSGGNNSGVNPTQPVTP